MPKYLLQSSLTQDGLKGTMKEGGTARREAIAKAYEALGGKLEALYYAFGQTDLYAIVDLPDNVSAVAASMVANAGGASKVTYTPLVTPEEIDRAAQVAQGVTSAYRAPGR